MNRFAYGEEDIVTLAVSLLFGIGRNHPFVQGNKRTAFVAAVDFLGVNGYALQAPDSEDLGRSIEAALRDDVSEERLVEQLREHVSLNRPSPR